MHEHLKLLFLHTFFYYIVTILLIIVKTITSINIHNTH